ncbi:MAG TPA: GtrA family protein [Solirubrobacteraceae bacterium]|nr:GtrA family protein [Solirubrobacteraceae bacterium]
MVSDLYTRLRASAHAGKITRYAIGSVIALVTSVVVFALMYVLGINTTICSIGAFIAGAVPNWILNRRWAWKIRGQVSIMREVFGYILISIAVLVMSSAATGWTSSEVQSIPAHHGIRVILVTAAYVAVQAFFFGIKYIVYEHWVFSGRSRVRAALRSRRQVWTAARANRTP